jgi:hypothetical protein
MNRMISQRKRSSKRSLLSRAFGFETLEQRRLLSGDICQSNMALLAQQAPAALVASDLSSNNLSSNSTRLQSVSASLVDDAFRDNHSWYQAADLGSVSQVKTIPNLVLNQSDWYRFRLDQTATSSSSVSIQFQNQNGDLELAVYNANGQLLGYSNGTGNREVVPLARFGSGTFYVFVYGDNGATNRSYTLIVNSGRANPTAAPTPTTTSASPSSTNTAPTSTAPSTTPRSALTDDRFESNNSLSQASNLGTLAATRTEANLVLADSNDWYRFTTTGRGSSANRVGITFRHANGDLDIELYNSSGRRIGISNGVGNSESISMAGMASGTYYLRVYGYRGATNSNYALSISPGVASTTPTTPTVPTTPTTPTTPTAPTTASSGFQIEVRSTGLTASQQATVQQAVTRWQQVIVGDLPNAVYNGRPVDDLLIDLQASSIDGVGGVLGQAGPDRFRSGSQLPYHGSIQFDTADVAQLESNGTFYDVILHEIGHVLGIGSIWQGLGLTSGLNTNDPRFTGRQATAAYNAITGGNATSVPIENSGGPGTIDSHWRESIFRNELMTGYVGPGTRLPLSAITVGSLADLGYQVNIAAADAYRI